MAVVVRVLFVCTGNICRSPIAHGVFEHLVGRAELADRIAADSAGTIDYHLGVPPDSRARRAAARRGYSLDHLRARQLRARDYREFDLVVAMDTGHLAHMRDRCETALAGKLRLFREFSDSGGDVPDPFYGNAQDFEAVLDLVEPGCRGLLTWVRDQWSI